MAQTLLAQSIRDDLHKLTPSEKRAARALLASYPVAGLGPLSSFAEEARVSPPTVLRFIAKLGFASYPSFQKRLRDELEESVKSPLEKASPARAERSPRFAAALSAIAANIADTARYLPEAEFEAVCAELSRRRSIILIGGRFTDSIAEYMAAHLRILRPGVMRFGGQAANWADQLLDIGPRDAVVFFDIRRYSQDLVETAQAVAATKAAIILVTDQWLSPIARRAAHVLPCKIDVDATWDSSVALMAVAEAIVQRVTELTWEEARPRIERLEALDVEGLRRISPKPPEGGS